VRHISRVNCAEISRDRQGQAAYETFSIEHRFQQSKSRSSRFKEICARGHQSVVLSKSRYFTAVSQCRIKTVADACYLSQQALVTSFLVVSIRLMTLKDPEL